MVVVVLRLLSGYIRFACSNGLIIGTGIESMNMRHQKDWKQPVHKFLDEYADTVAQKAEERLEMQKRPLAHVNLRNFLEEAVSLRYSLKDVMDIYELNLIRRQEDVRRDVWTTYNRVQEALTQGLFTRRIKHEDKENWSQARKLTDINELSRVNTELYKLALEYA